MSNLGDLNEHLFNQLNRLSDDSLKGDDLKDEINRAKTVSDLSKRVIETGRLALDAERFKDDKWNAEAELPKMLSDGSE